MTSSPLSSLRLRGVSLPGLSHFHVASTQQDQPQAAVSPAFSGTLSLALPRGKLTGDAGFSASTAFLHLSPFPEDFTLEHALSQTWTVPTLLAQRTEQPP